MPNLFDSTQTTKPSLLNPVKPLFKDMMHDASKYYGKGTYMYPKRTVAGFGETTRDAFSGMKDLAAANSDGNGMAPHLQSIMSNGGFNQGQMDSMASLRNLANNANLNHLINDPNGMTQAQNQAYSGLQNTVYGNNANLRQTFNQGGLTNDQHLVADRYRTEMSSPFDINANPAYMSVRQQALDEQSKALAGRAAAAGRYGGGADQAILAREQGNLANRMDDAEYRNWQQQRNNATSGLAGLSQTGFGNQLNINSAQQSGYQNIGNMGAMGVGQQNTAIGTKAGLENSLFNMNQAGLSNMGQAYDTAMQPFYTQRAVGQEWDNKRQQILDDKVNRYNQADPFAHIAKYMSLANGAPYGSTQTTSPSPGQIAFGTGTGLLATMSAMRNWGQPYGGTGSAGFGY